jgi:hypothetical protein
LIETKLTSFLDEEYQKLREQKASGPKAKAKAAA